MTLSPDCWAMVSRLYHEALARPVDARAAFLAEACAGDETVRAEVESLLAQSISSDRLLMGGGLEMAAGLISDDSATLRIGYRLGVYEILASIGAGGMGEVYRARDTRLGRDVAIKILPKAFTDDPARLARFEREARVLATLNHPNIATIHGSEESDGIRALVMELVDGETLSERIARGRIRIADTLAIATQMADALDAAHEKGIVHRDLKPANVKITPSGTVKVLDFGLAKVASDGSGASQAPTVTVDRTREGMILGTAAYMSPEQARGQSVDKRTDIWAFGCVLYEMLTGRSAFARDTLSDTIAAILERQPDWTALPGGVPAGAKRVLRRCLEKDPRNRLRDIGNARIDLNEPATAVTTRPQVSTSQLVIGGALSVALVVGAMTGLQMAPDPPVSQSADPVRFSFAAPDGLRVQGVPAPSPDGRQIAFVGRDADGKSSLWIRSMDSGEPRRIEGTDGADGPFWSPDSQFVGFGVSSEGRLKRADVRGGPVMNTSRMSDAFLGATWNQNGVVLLAPDSRVPLLRVPASGGTPQPVTVLDSTRRENSHRWPHFLPDGRHFLYTARSDVRENTGIYVGSLDSNDRTWLVEAQSSAVYAPPGYLLFVREGTLLAQPFDASTLRLSGEPVALAGNVAHNPTGANAWFSVSANGRIVAYVTGSETTAELVWYDRTGTKRNATGVEGGFQQIRLAPDGKRAAVVMADRDSGNRDIWLVNSLDDGLSRLTSHPANDWHPAWSPDGAEIAFASDRNGSSTVYRKASNGAATETLIPTTGVAGNVFPDEWSRKDGILAVHVSTPATLLDVWVLSLTPAGRSFPVAQTRFQELTPSFSADGRWIAYVSDESGTPEVYVQRLGQSASQRVSNAGGRFVKWRSDGRELFFVDAANTFVAVAVDASDKFVHSPPVHLFDACSAPGLGADGAPYDVTADGSRSLWLCPTPPRKPSLVNVFVGWTSLAE